MIPEIPEDPLSPILFLSFYGSDSLHTIQSGSFKAHSELVRVDIAGNKLKNISSDAFMGLKRLKHLSLRSNDIQELPDDIFTHVPNLEELDLSLNQLKVLPKSIESLTKLISIRLQNNPLHCPCEIIDFGLHLNYLETRHSSVRCASPQEVEGQRLAELAASYAGALNTTRHLGYININNIEDNYLAKGLLHRWPLPQCPVGDVGGKYTKEEDGLEKSQPVIVAGPVSVYGVEGDTITFKCMVKGTPEPQVYWIVPSEDNRWYRLFSRRRILQLKELHDYNQGTYTCVARNSEGQVSSSATVQIIPASKARIVKSSLPEESSKSLGSTVTLHCSAKGRPKPKISWIWDSRSTKKSLATSEKYLVKDLESERSESYHGLSESAENSAYEDEATKLLVIRNLTERDTDGRYVCYASNRLGTAQVSTIIRLKKDESPINIPTEEPKMTEEEMNKFDKEPEEVNGEKPDVLKNVIDSARKRIEEAVQKTAERLRDPNRQRSSSDIASLFRQPSKAALELAKAAEVYEVALEEITKHLRQSSNKLSTGGESLNSYTEDTDEDDNTAKALGIQLTTDQLAILSQLSGCQQPLNVDPCARQLCFHLKYRSIDGKCNNLNNPLWGAALTTFYRLQPPEYENGVNSPIGWNLDRLYFGYPKPSARLVSRELLANASKVSEIENNLKVFQMDMVRMTKEYDTQIGFLNSSISSINRMEDFSDILEYERLMKSRNEEFRTRFPNEFKESNMIFNRKMSKSTRRTLFDEDQENSAFLFQWGQFLDHDLVLTPVDFSTSRFSDGLNCNETCVNDPPCFPIFVPPNDPRIRHQCIGFARSTATCGSGSTSFLTGRPHFREQINQITGFLDASTVYGSDQIEADNLREAVFDEGKLRVGMKTAAGKHLLPFNIRGQIDCQADPSQDFVPCFKAGDHRNNENVNLITTHVIWMRQHNLLADRLREMNPHWTGDRLYQEARKIVGAQMQIISYDYWLPKILGPEGMKLLGSRYTGYDDTVNPSISNEFSTAAFRFGHTLVPPVIFRLDSNWNPISEGHLMLRNAFFAPERLLKDGGIDPLIRGLLYHGVRERTRTPALNSELTEKLFSMAHELALDLASLNVQRGRDHGLPSYTAYANSSCNLLNEKYPKSFESLKHLITSKSVRNSMRKIYGSPGNVDLFVGGVLEDLLPGARVGPTFACIIADQFKRLRSGDRFWYEAPGVFTAIQIAELKRAGGSLSRVLCDNGDDIQEVQIDAFLRPKSKADIHNCDSGHIPKLNLAFWKECPNSINNDISYSIKSFENEQSGRLNERFTRSVPQHEDPDFAAKIEHLEETIRDLKEKIEQLSK